jgi:beta-phosphoglucomutase
VVVENAPLGIRSAKAAGMFRIALNTTLEQEHLAGADVILNGHKALVNFLYEKTLDCKVIVL